MQYILSLPLLEIHLFGVFSSLALVVATDFMGFLWLIGKKKTLSKRLLSISHALIWVGLIITILAGFFMFLDFPEYLLSLTAFRLKMVFVVLLVVNAFIIGKHMDIATTMSFKDVPRKTKIQLIASGLASTTGWVGAFIAAQMLS